MRTRIALLLLVALSPAPVWAAEGKTEKEALAALQGAWKVTGYEAGEDAGPLPDVSFWLVIQGDKVFYGGKEWAGLKVDPTATPAGIDLTRRHPDRVCEGIYSLDGDTLKLCINRQTEGVKERPNAFTTKDKPDWRVLQLTRDKDRKADDLDGLGGFVGMQLRLEDEGKKIVIAALIDDSPAKKADLKKDDVILKVGGQEVTDLRGCVRMVQSVKPGSDLTLRVKRGEKELDVTVKVGVVPFFLLN
jgi:uncharacterized protein (TIGR03067 family)